ncbi:hypothetical protein D3C75_179110 [compost metagenome]
MHNYKITWRAARVNAGYTLKQISDATGKHIDSIRRYERDSSDIPWDLMNHLLELYKVPSELVYCGIESDLIGIIRKYANIS